MVMMKTGSSDIYEKLPIHFATTFQCIKNLIIFSDLAQNVGGYQVIDALAPISDTTRSSNDDFKLYDRMQEWQRDGQDISKLGSGWDLDKWKFLPLLHRAFDDADDSIDWFIMIEPDTSLSWLNLLLYLEQLDPAKAHYIGNQAEINLTGFAHGGSGILISRQAAQLLQKARRTFPGGGRQAYDLYWEYLTAKQCCGDLVVAMAFLEAGVPFTGRWPMFQGETLSSLDWTYQHWCTPAITWHHVDQREIDMHWRFQAEWAAKIGWETPYLFRDVFAQHAERHVSSNNKTRWDNMSQYRKIDLHDEHFANADNLEKDSVTSVEACAAACERKPANECVQWMWSTGRCFLDKHIRLGRSDQGEEEHWESGWLLGRILDFKKEQERCEIKWW